MHSSGSASQSVFSWRLPITSFRLPWRFYATQLGSDAELHNASAVTRGAELSQTAAVRASTGAVRGWQSLLLDMCLALREIPANALLAVGR